MKLPAILKNQTSLAAIYVERSSLLQRCRKPYSSQHKLANLVVLTYMAVGLALPLGGLCGSALAVLTWTATLTKITVPTPITGTLMCIGSIAMWFTTIWCLLTPLALIVTAVQRRYAGLVAPLICAGWIGFIITLSSLLTALSPTKDFLTMETRGAIIILSFLVGAYYGAKCNLKVIRDIRSEGADWVPEVMGCKKAHSSDLVTGS